MKKPVKKTEFYNKKARFDFQILDSFEAGIVLTGHEIKAIRSGRVNMTNSYAKILNSEAFWIGALINAQEGDPQRTRKLLLRKDQIDKLTGKTKEKGLTLVPIKLYMKKGKAKIELGLGKGMKEYEKRNVIKQRELNREVEQKVKEYNQ